MNQTRVCKIKYFFSACFVLTLVLTGTAQNDTVNSPDSTTLSSYAFFDLSYTSSLVNSGSGYSESLSATLMESSFYHKSGFWAGVLPTLYTNATSLSYDFDVSLGYQNFMDNGWDINFYYTNHHFKGDTLVKGINYQHNLTASVGYNYGALYLFSQGYSYLGKSNNYFTEIGISLWNDFNAVFSPNDYISLSPLFSLSWGTDNFLFDDLTFRGTRLLEYYFNQKGYESHGFDFQSIDFIVPVAYTYNDISVSVSYILSIPGNKYKSLGWNNQSGFMVSLNYFLNF